MSLLNVQYDEMSYDNLTNIRHNFRRIEPDVFRKYDEPGFFFWKPIFYFYNGDDDAYGLGCSGLLHPSWSNKDTVYNEINDNSNTNEQTALKDVNGIEHDVQLPNSAYNYLLRNDEQKRAALLKDFIILLSEISSKTPWYFKEVSGIEDALSRTSFYKSPKIDEERKKITITCLADSIDTRIGNMLDMYRAACFSWQTKREIVPANLRKFDMGIYIYLQPTQRNVHKSIKKVSHKYLEFHNCEIDIDSCKVNDSFSNETASQIEYKIVISYDHCFDNRYSNNVLGLIGDAIMTDFVVGDSLETDVNNFSFSANKRDDYDGANGKYGEIYNSTLVQEFGKGFVSGLLNNAKDLTVGAAIQAAKTGLGGLLLGNLYHGSLLSSLRSVAQGNIVTGGVDAIKAISNIEGHKNALKNALGTFESATVDKINKPKSEKSESLGNLYENSDTSESTKDKNKSSRNKTTIKLGNLNKNKSIINNI